MDLQNIADHLGFDLDDVQMLMDMFLQNANQSLKDLDTAIETVDYIGIKNASHAIKGSAANLMLDEVSAISSQIEEFAKQESNIDYTKLSIELREKLLVLEQMKETVW